MDEPLFPCLHLTVGLLPLETVRGDPVGSTVYSFDLSLTERVWVARPGGKWLRFIGTTWEATGTIGSVPDNKAAQKIKDMIRDKVDEFTIAYFKENPQPLATGAGTQ